MLKLSCAKSPILVKKTILFFENFFFKKKNWFFLYKISFFFRNFLINTAFIAFFWDISKKKKTKKKKIKNIFFFKKKFTVFLLNIVNSKIRISDLVIKFIFINRFFFVFWKKEWFLLKKKRQSLSVFVKKRKLKVNLNVLKSKFIIRNSFFLKKKNKHLFNYNLGFSIKETCLSLVEVFFS